ncbi:MAG TPA: RNA polymerase factor sigma-54 [Bacteroidia bacterium]|jgi:RNA polymerase sigma-54 factor|nr:RNA polymerase factor sigma-54 [Bacteroidia bacterium]
MLKQTLQQKQQLKLTPQQMLVQKLLQMPVISMEQRIKEEIESNPALEEATETEWDSKDEQEIGSDEDIDTRTSDSDEFDATDFMEESDEYVPAYKLSANNTSSDEERKEIPIVSTNSFQDSLSAQLSLRNLKDRQLMLADYIIGNIDDDGYLRRDLYSISNDITFLQNILTDENELTPILEAIQALDPPGVGARNLQECLLLQLKRKTEKSACIRTAIEILEKGFDEFSKKNYDKLKEITHADDKQLKEAIAEITKLNPKPGQTYSDGTENAGQMIPDFTVNSWSGKFEVLLNSRNSNKIRLSNIYEEMVDKKAPKDKLHKEAASFARQRIDAAKGFIDALKQREETLLRVMNAILDYQKEYFLEGDEAKLKPMLLKDIAKKTGYDISTISRVVSSKYVQTNFGTKLLKNLFSEAFQKESGEEVSVKEVKNLLKEMIDAEDKKNPLNDEAIVEQLEEKGYKVARRTVAKYREQLGVPVARMRKEI